MAWRRGDEDEDAKVGAFVFAEYVIAATERARKGF